MCIAFYCHFWSAELVQFPVLFVCNESSLITNRKMPSLDQTPKYPPESYTPLEESRLKEFRTKVSNLDGMNSEWLEDAHLIRWLRARNLDTGKAYTMLEKSLEWRKEHSVDGILEREDLPDDMKAKMPSALCGVDRNGYPILVCPFGNMDMREFLNKHGRDQFYRYQIVNCEKMMRILRNFGEEQGRPVAQFVEIIDLEGYNFRQFTSKACLDFMGEIQVVMDSNYPEILRYCMVVNAPKIFHVFFNIIKPAIPKKTLEKMYIYGTDRESWKKVVAEKFPVEQIPPRWGGTREGSDEYCSQDDIWLNGPVPLSHFNPDAPDPSLTTATIRARDSLKIKLNVTKPESSIGWKFRTQDHDIGCQIIFGDEEVVMPFSRVPSNKEVQESSHSCEKLGVYTFLLDNSYSVYRAKKVFYNVYVIEP